MQRDGGDSPSSVSSHSGQGCPMRHWLLSAVLDPAGVSEVTSRAKGWRRQCNDWDGVGKVPALSGWAETFHTVAVVSHLLGGPHS